MNNKKAINYIQDLGALIALVLLVLVVLVLAVLVLLVLAVLAVLGIVGAVVVLIVIHFFPHILPPARLMPGTDTFRFPVYQLRD